MDIFENIKNSFVNIINNPLRSGLTMLGIIIGVSSVVIMIAIGTGAQKKVLANIESLGSNLLILSPGNQTQTDVRNSFNKTSSFNNDDYLNLFDLQLIKNISPETSLRKQVIYKNKNTSATVTGVLPSYSDVRNFNLDYGQFIKKENNFNADKVAVIGTEILSNFFENKNPIGEDIVIDNNIFTIIGVMEEKSSQSFSRNANSVIFLPLETLQKRILGKDQVDIIYLSAKDKDNINEAMEEIKYQLMIDHQITDPEKIDFTILNQADALETMNQVTQVFTILLGSIASISLIVGGIGVMNIMLVSVTERTREIGIRKAIGAKNKDILYQFMIESTFLSIMGGLIGVFLSFLIVFIISNYFQMEAVISFSSILIAISFSFGVGLFFGVFPAYKASLLKPIDALRFE
jgi:putative ABC transport system permease protein